mmetsp:Transcript_77738/g.141403  ORF Transcript_77738/g.141403 Transcript_77738/m.141403 type:complete len:844 (-) Transcript_77738:55-2586(-)
MGRSNFRKVLSYSRQGLTDYDLDGLALKEESVTYEEVDFSQNKLSSVGLRAVVDLCCRCEKLRVVKLYKNEIDDSGAKHLARLLQHCPSVEECHLSHNRLTAKGVKIIVKAADTARSENSRPLWMRLEMNEIEDPDKVLLDLERRLSVCGREDENHCTARVCCWSCKTHLPFLYSQRQSPQVPAQSTEPSGAKSKGKGTAVAASSYAQSKTGKDTYHADTASSQPSSAGRKGKGNAGKQDQAEGKGCAAKQDADSQPSGTSRKGKGSKAAGVDVQPAASSVEATASALSASGKKGKGKKAQSDEETGDRKTSEDNQKVKVAELDRMLNGASRATAAAEILAKVRPASKPAGPESTDEPDNSNEKIEKDKPNKVELACALASGPEENDAAANQYDPTPVDLSELIIPGATVLPGGIEKDQNVLRLEKAWRARDVFRTAEDDKQLAECLAALNTICSELETGQVWQASAIGSVASGFGTTGCDFDVVVNRVSGSEWSDPQSILLKLRNLLSQSDFAVKSTILQARVPILKLEYKGRDIDLSACNTRPQKNTRLLKAYGMIHERVGELIVAVKLWAKDAGLCGAKNGHLSSYALVLMVIYFLQVMESICLPCLQDGGSKDSSFESDEGAKARVKACPMPGCPALEASFEMLLGGFFAFYAGTGGPWGFTAFDWGSEVVSVRLGRRERRDSDVFSLLNGRDAHRLHIEDPFELNRNLNDVLWTHPVANEVQLYHNLVTMDNTAKMVHLHVVQLAPPPIFPTLMGPPPFFPPPPLHAAWDPPLRAENAYSCPPEPHKAPQQSPSDTRGKHTRSQPIKSLEHTSGKPHKRQFGKKGPYNSSSVHGRGRA